MKNRKKQSRLFRFAVMSMAAVCIQGCGGVVVEENAANQGTEDMPLETESETKLPQNQLMNTEEKDEGYTSRENSAQNTKNTNTLNSAQTAEKDAEMTSQLQLGAAMEIPVGFKKIPAESEANEALEKAIREYYKVTEGVYDTIGYYYNYVDLNGDSKDEILALVFHVGQEVNGEAEVDKQKLLWLSIADENLTERAVLQDFGECSMPVYISYHMTEGFRDLLIKADREDETYILCTWNKDRYLWKGEGKEIETIEGYEGEVILTGDEDYHAVLESLADND